MKDLSSISKKSLSDDHKTDYDIFETYMNTYLDGYKWRLYVLYKRNTIQSLIFSSLCSIVACTVYMPKNSMCPKKLFMGSNLPFSATKMDPCTDACSQKVRGRRKPISQLPFSVKNREQRDRLLIRLCTTIPHLHITLKLEKLIERYFDLKKETLL